jgi:galactose mutarotase-like enzyme
LTQNSETLKIYPFNFEFYITYSLNKNSLKVEYKVKNTGDNTMYYSVGAHEAYACPEGIDKYSVKFEKSESFYSNVLNGNLLEENKILIAENTDTIKLNYDYFKVDALVFKTLESKKVILQNDSGRKIILDYKGFPYFLLWTKPNAPYICLEPWRGIPDGMNPSGNLTEKEGIIKLEKGKTDKSIHKITFQI